MGLNAHFRFKISQLTLYGPPTAMFMPVPASTWLSGGINPVGESQNQPFQLSFNRFLRVDFQGSRVTSDGGLLLVRELDERLGLTRFIQNRLVDSRTGRRYYRF
jgi:hypothetical protein